MVHFIILLYILPIKITVQLLNVFFSRFILFDEGLIRLERLE